MQTIALQSYEDIKTGYPTGRVGSNGKWSKLRDTEKLAMYLLAELALEYDNEIPFNKESLEKRMGISTPINWKSLFAAGEIYFPEGDRAKSDIEERMEVVIDNWNRTAKVSPLPLVHRIGKTGSRRIRLRARCKETFFWKNHVKALGIAVRSGWLNGENPRGWKMDLDFFLRGGSIQKILEGKYTNKEDQTVWISRDGKTMYEIPSKIHPLDTIIPDYDKGE